MSNLSSTVAAGSPQDSLSQQVNAALRAMALLGFDYLAEARAAILSHDDYAERWEIDNEHRATIALWRRATKGGAR